MEGFINTNLNVVPILTDGDEPGCELVHLREPSPRRALPASFLGGLFASHCRGRPLLGGRWRLSCSASRAIPFEFTSAAPEIPL